MTTKRQDEHDRYGAVLLSNEDKAEALIYCIAHGATEDALGHALDLVERLRRQCRRQCRLVYKSRRHDQAFTMKALRKRHHLYRSYQDYRAWLERTSQQEIQIP